MEIQIIVSKRELTEHGIQSAALKSFVLHQLSAPAIDPTYGIDTNVLDINVKLRMTDE
jgi:hypothetical protein